MEESRQAQVLMNQVGDYNDTVDALIAFTALLAHDGNDVIPEVQYGFGRRMCTSDQNMVMKDNEVTPDLAAQLGDKFGIVAEVKKSLPKDIRNWKGIVRRLRKYDDSLEGWWTDDGFIERSDAVLLLHHSRARTFARYLENQLEGDLCGDVGENTSIVDFVKSDETETYIAFQLEYGEIRDERVAESLLNCVQVSLEKARYTFPCVHYYDAKPPMAKLLTDLWMQVFPSRLYGKKYDEKLRAVPIDVSVAEAAMELQSAYGSGMLLSDDRSCEFPRRAWVRESFYRLVSHRLAIQNDEEGEEFKVLFRSIRGNVLRHFVVMECNDSEDDVVGDEPRGQLPLFSS